MPKVGKEGDTRRIQGNHESTLRLGSGQAKTGKHESEEKYLRQ
jgi:hypothetical protein